MEKKQYIIRKSYLAEAMSYLGFHYSKNGYGKDTVYEFENTDQFNKALTGLMELKAKVGQYIE